jgi:hypothetical protein
MARLTPVAGLLAVGGCWATLERNLDYVLAPEAFENTLFLPFTGLYPLAQILVNLVG